MSSKAELRKLMRSVMSRVAAEDRKQQSKFVRERLISHPVYANSRNLSVYLSTEVELDTTHILKHALEIDKKSCFVPFVPKSRAWIGSFCDAGSPRMQMVELRSMEQYHGLPINNYGIREPDEVMATHERRVSLSQNLLLDLIIVPGMAFSTDGRRLGHGKGYYDEFLNYYQEYAPENKRPYTIGLALNQQIVEDPLALDGQDYQVDEVLFV